MKEYILNLKFENWSNQLWFMKDGNLVEDGEKWINAINEIEKIKESSLDAMEYQDKVIEFLKKLGFIRVQK